MTLSLNRFAAGCYHVSHGPTTVMFGHGTPRTNVDSLSLQRHAKLRRRAQFKFVLVLALPPEAAIDESGLKSQYAHRAPCWSARRTKIASGFIRNSKPCRPNAIPDKPSTRMCHTRCARLKRKAAPIVMSRKTTTTTREWRRCFCKAQTCASTRAAASSLPSRMSRLRSRRL